MIAGHAVSDAHKSYFSQSENVYSLYHYTPGETGIWPLFSAVSSRWFLDKLAASLSPRRLAYEPDEKVRASLAGICLENYDLAVSRYLSPAARAGLLSPSMPPIIIDIDDRDDLVLSSKIQHYRFNPVVAALYRRHARSAARIMTEKLAHASHLWVVSDAELNTINASSASVLPNIPYREKEAADNPPPSEKSQTILFVGLADHPPNWHGVNHFLRRVWPQIARAAPQAQLRLAGRGWEALPARLKALRNVTIAGFVKEIAEEYRVARFVVAPLNSGAGSKIKVIEALSYGRAVVADAHAAAGFEAADESGIVVTNNDEEMTAACVALLQDNGAPLRLGAQGCRHVREKFSRRRVEKIISADCARVLSRKKLSVRG